MVVRVSSDLGSCLKDCDEHNTDAIDSPDYCVGVMFEMPGGICSMYSEIGEVHHGQNEEGQGLDRNGAVLIRSPDGVVAAEQEEQVGDRN